MSRHTAGPWKFDNNLGCKSIKGGKCGSHKQAQYTVIADTVGLSDEDTDRANARLIAAAPDLLDVLLAIQADQSWRTNDNSLWPRINEVVRLATQPLPPPNEEV